MNTYLIVKTLHIISATLMVGTGFGTAFYLFWANRSGSVAAQSVVSHWVIKADWWQQCSRVHTASISRIRVGK